MKKQKYDTVMALGTKLATRLVIGLLLVGMACLLLTGCGSQQQLAQDRSTINFVIGGEPYSLDPALSTSLVDGTIQLAIFDGLTRKDANNEIQPALAKNWDISPDGKTYTFHLREGICWGDGTPITAEDFAYSWLRCLNPETGSSNAYMLYPILKAEEYNSEECDAAEVGIKVIDDKTLQVQLASPAAYFLDLVSFHSFYPVPRAIVEADPEGWASNAGIMGCGPYKLAKWNHSSLLELEANDNYWNADEVKTKHVRLPISDSASTRLTLFESGLVDAMEEPPTADQDRLEKSGLYKVIPMLGTYYYVFNVTKPPFDNIKVRQAFSLAVQRENLIKYVVRNGRQPAYAFVPFGMKFNGKDFRDEGGNLITEDVEQAKKLLAESGYLNNPVPITILYNTSEIRKAIAEGVQDMWKNNLGVKVDITNQESKVFFDTRENGDYQVASADWIADFGDPVNFLEVFQAKANDAQYHDEEFNSLVAQAKEELDEHKRIQLFHRAERKLFTDAVVIPFYFTSQPMVISSHLHNLFVSPMGLTDFMCAYKE